MLNSEDSKISFPIPSEHLIPQKNPFVLVDALLDASADHAISQFTIVEGHLLLENNELHESGCIENMAQTCALHSGFIYRSSVPATQMSTTNLTVPVGFIGAMNDVTFYRRACVGEQLKTFLQIQHKIGTASVVNCEVFSGSECIAKANMKIFIVEEPNANV